MNKNTKYTLPYLQNELMKRIEVANDKNLSIQEQRKETQRTIEIISVSKAIIAEMNAVARICELGFNAKAIEKAFELLGVEPRTTKQPRKKNIA